MATAWATDNILVNVALPGFIDTEQTQQAREQVPTMNERVLSRTPAERRGVADDLSGIAAFLGSSGSDFIIGGHSGRRRLFRATLIPCAARPLLPNAQLTNSQPEVLARRR